MSSTDSRDPCNVPASATGNPPTTSEIVQEVHDSTVGKYIGQTKWFSDKRGYGFITVQDGEYKGKDIFVHHSGIKPLNSNYKTLRKGEYINFNIIDGDHGMQAVDVTGILGGSLMCDIVPMNKSSMPGIPGMGGEYLPPPPPPPSIHPFMGGNGGSRGAPRRAVGMSNDGDFMTVVGRGGPRGFGGGRGAYNASG